MKNKKKQKDIPFDIAIEAIIILRTLNPKKFTLRMLEKMLDRHYTTIDQLYKDHFGEYVKKYNLPE